MNAYPLKPLSARSGRPLARRTQDVFYDIDTNLPLYYEDNHPGPVPLALATPDAQGIWGGLTQDERVAHQQHPIGDGNSAA